MVSDLGSERPAHGHVLADGATHAGVVDRLPDWSIVGRESAGRLGRQDVLSRDASGGAAAGDPRQIQPQLLGELPRSRRGRDAHLRHGISADNCQTSSLPPPRERHLH